MTQTKKNNLPFRPKEHAEDYILTHILSGAYPPGSVLPGERVLSEEIGVTRPTLRETLHRLAGEGWLTIKQGKPTTVNDYWNTGGLGLLNTMARYGEYLPQNFISYLLDARAAVLPSMAFQAATNSPEVISGVLERTSSLKNTAKAYTRFDWELQKLFARESKNPLAVMLLNSFEVMYLALGQFYFSHQKGKQTSAGYYELLKAALQIGPREVASLVRAEMIKAREIWSEINDLKPS
ncbi:MAG: fatty acid metabolism transcriptional regulator FadR [Proteobacteria bacterium]|nr:fatty acid metabolism transcriptional regulator FadR [Pseudomonadota bacterium]